MRLRTETGRLKISAFAQAGDALLERPNVEKPTLAHARSLALFRTDGG
jgi:hypothetical protein